MANPNYYIGQGTGANVNIFQGKLAPGRADSVIFDRVPIDPPGPDRERWIRITNLRSHAASLGPGSFPVPITVLLTAAGSFEIPVQNPLSTIGVPIASFSTSVSPGTPPVFSACTPQNPALAVNPEAATGTSQFSVRFTELLPSGFKTRTAAIFSGENTSPPPVSQNMFIPALNSETGFFDLFFPDLGSRGNLALAGLADHGTRLVARFNTIPPGVKIFTKAAITAPSAYPAVVRLVLTDANGAGPFSPIPATASGLAQVPMTGPSTAIAVFEVLTGDASSFNVIDIPFYVAYNGVPELGPTTTVNLSLGPLSTTFVASDATVPIPRFVDTSLAWNAFGFSQSACAAAPNVTSQMQITQSGFYLSGKDVLQNVIVKNIGSSPVANPIWLVLDSLSSNTSLLNPAGLTSAALPAGSPFVGTGLFGSLQPGQSTNFLLRFRRPVSGPITYTKRVLAGPYPR